MRISSGSCACPLTRQAQYLSRRLHSAVARSPASAGRDGGRSCNSRPEPGSDRLVGVQMIARGLAREKPIDRLITLDVESCQIRPRCRTVVRCDRVDRNVQRLMPARAAVTILPGRQRNHEQNQQQYQDAQHLEAAAARLRIARASRRAGGWGAAGGWSAAAGWSGPARRHSADSTLNFATSPSVAA